MHPTRTDRSTTRLLRGGVELALVHRHGLLTLAQEIDDLVVSVQLALESERLTSENLSQLAEIRSSGARIVAAGDAERRRIERDLHDGAQQRLVALLLRMRVIQSEIALPAPGAAETELRGTISDHRRLAHGVYPVLLKDAGLRAALNALAESRCLDVEGGADERYPDVVESTAYVLVARFSDGGPTAVRIGRDDSRLIIDVSVTGRTDGAVDLSDRIQTLGGTLELTVNEATTRATLALPIGARFDIGSVGHSPRPDQRDW